MKKEGGMVKRLSEVLKYNHVNVNKYKLSLVVILEIIWLSAYCLVLPNYPQVLKGESLYLVIVVMFMYSFGP